MVGIAFNSSIFGLTVTVIVFVEEAPLLSVTLYITVYVPAFEVSTSLLNTSTFSVISPSSLSEAVTASNASNVSPTVNVLSLALMVGIAFNSSIFGLTVKITSISVILL